MATSRGWPARPCSCHAARACSNEPATISAGIEGPMYPSPQRAMRARAAGANPPNSMGTWRGGTIVAAADRLATPDASVGVKGGVDALAEPLGAETIDDEVVGAATD